MIYWHPLLFIALLGCLALWILRTRDNLPHPIILSIAIMFPVGFALTSWLLFWSYVAAPSFGSSVSIALSFIVLALFIFIILSRKPDFSVFNFTGLRDEIKSLKPESLTGWIRLFFLIVGTLFLCWALYRFFMMASSMLVWNAYGRWDAKFIWHLKAKFYFRDPSLWTNMFSPLINWSHPDYPLFLPGAIAWGWNWIGREGLAWPHFINHIFALSGAVLLIWHFRTLGKLATGFWAAAFLLTLQIYNFWTIELYADPVLSFQIGASVIFFLQFLRTSRWAFAFLTGFMAGLALWTKLDGIFFFLWISCLFFFYSLTGKYSNSKKRSFEAAYFAGAAVFLTAFLYQKIFLAPHGEYWGSGRTIADYFNALFMQPAKSIYILQNFFHYLFEMGHWNYLWFFFAGALVYKMLFWKTSLRYSEIGAYITFLIWAGYFCILHISPYEINMQIITALDRLLLHSIFPAILFVFEAFSSPFGAETKSDQNQLYR